MPTNNNPTKQGNDIEDERERRQEQASQQPRDEMGRFEEDQEGRDEGVHGRQTSRMNAPDDEELHEEFHEQLGQDRQGQRARSRAGEAGDDSGDDSGADEADDLPVDRQREVSEEERERDDGDVVSREDADSEGESSERLQAGQRGRSKQSINASKRPRDQRGRFESANRSKKSSSDEQR